MLCFPGASGVLAVSGLLLVTAPLRRPFFMAIAEVLSLVVIGTCFCEFVAVNSYSLPASRRNPPEDSALDAHGPPPVLPRTVFDKVQLCQLGLDFAQASS